MFTLPSQQNLPLPVYQMVLRTEVVTIGHDSVSSGFQGNQGQVHKLILSLISIVCCIAGPTSLLWGGHELYLEYSYPN